MSQKASLIKIYEYALNQEYTGKTFFETFLQKLSVGSAVEAFKKLVQEEERHIQFINAILNKLREGKEFNFDEVKEFVMEPSNFFAERAKSQFLDESIYSSMVPDITVFNTAWLIEKDLSEFYRKMAEKVSGEARKSLQLLAEWEKSHEEFFRGYRDKLQEIYERLPWGG